MCRGTNGAHRELEHGVSYCAAGQRMHIDLGEFGGQSIETGNVGRLRLAVAIAAVFVDIAKMYPHLRVTSVVIEGTTEERVALNAVAS